jgi:hypothetical protein
MRWAGHVAHMGENYMCGLGGNLEGKREMRRHGLMWEYNIVTFMGDLQDGVLDWMIGFIAPYTFTLETTSNYSAIADLHTLQFTIAHTLGLSVFTSHILATNLPQSHCHFTSHMNSSFHNLVPFMPLLCKCQFQRLDYSQLLFSTTPSNILCPSAWTLRKTQPVMLRRCVYWSVA